MLGWFKVYTYTVIEALTNQYYFVDLMLFKQPAAADDIQFSQTNLQNK